MMNTAERLLGTLSFHSRTAKTGKTTDERAVELLSDFRFCRELFKLMDLLLRVVGLGARRQKIREVSHVLGSLLVGVPVREHGR